MIEDELEISSRALRMKLSELNAALLTARLAETNGHYTIARQALERVGDVLVGDGVVRVRLETRLASLPAMDRPIISREALLSNIEHELARS